MMTKGVTLGLAVSTMAINMALKGVPDSLGIMIPFLVITTTNLVMTIVMLKNVKNNHERNISNKNKPVEQILPRNICPAPRNARPVACRDWRPCQSCDDPHPNRHDPRPNLVVQLFQWKFETALDAWYLPIFGILLDLCLFHLVKWIVQMARQILS